LRHPALSSISTAENQPQPNKEEKMAYTPELDSHQSSTLRRIAWALDMPMTKAMTAVIEYVSDIIDNKRVCNACRDKTRCGSCPFNKGANDEKGS
jgi:hypothetical protein